MNILIKSAKIIDHTSEYHNRIADILIENGSITKIASSISEDKDTKVISLPNLHISQGWLDSSVCFAEPGYEERETIKNGLATAAKSGFTAVLVNSNTNPIPDSNTSISFLKNNANDNAVDLYPIGALTTKSDGEHLAELFDMKNAGAVAFYDYQLPIKNPNLLKIALQYAQSFDGLVYSFPVETKIAGKGVANEEVNATKLGLKGIPSLAEELQIARDLYVLEYAGGKLHIPTVSTAKAVELIAAAKNKGLDVSCSVAIHNLFFSDAALEEFDTNFKVLPPLRTKKDAAALITGVKNGVIDFVTSDHNPLDIELKRVDFDNAAFGAIALEALYGALQTLFDTETVIAVLTRNKERFGIKNYNIKEGNSANLSLFNPEEPYTFQKEHILSTSKNASFLGATLNGKTYGIINNNKLVLQYNNGKQ